ncbi:MAG: VanZ family protein [Oscillospiraceae bacterium]
MRRKTNITILITISVIYAAVMLYLLFLQRLHVLAVQVRPYWESVRISVNFMPFRTIRQLAGIIKSSSNSYLVWFSIRNIVGNIVMFIPLGFLLPCLFARQRRFLMLLLTVVCGILCVEIVQALTLLGSGDVDDLILNVFGAAMGYGFWSTPPVKRFLSRNGFLL